MHSLTEPNYLYAYIDDCVNDPEFTENSEPIVTPEPFKISAPDVQA